MASHDAAELDLPRSFRRSLRPLLLGGLVLAIIAQVVALSPSTLEEGGSAVVALDPATLVPENGGTLATGIPAGRIPEYTVDQFDYVSTHAGTKQWKLVADQANLYNGEKLVHAKRVRALLYDPDGNITVVTGKEAKYFMNQRDLEIFGDVKAVFPDGFELTSGYLRYRPGQRKIEIPTTYAVHGTGKEAGGQTIDFDSQGMDFQMARSEITLPSSVRFTLRPPKAESTTIESDRCVIFRDKQLAHFTMASGRPAASRFIKLTQPSMNGRSRRAELNYGDFSAVLQYLSMFEDVLIKETGKKSSLRYATGGRADFDNRRNLIVLSEFPQVYQDNDTVTGDVILMHRDTDIIEVENSNAFSSGVRAQE